MEGEGEGLVVAVISDFCQVLPSSSPLLFFGLCSPLALGDDITVGLSSEGSGTNTHTHTQR